MSLALSAFAIFNQQRMSNSQPRTRHPQGSGSAHGAQRVGVVRFNPYHDTGGDYSFAVALVDDAGAGVVITGLYHRDKCRVYAKPLAAWGSTYVLTDEEKDAIEQARQSGAP